MKKFLLIAIVLLALISFFALRNGSKKEDGGTIQNNVSEFLPDPSSATFLFEDGPITLSKGRSDINITPDSAIKEEIILTDIISYGDLNNDNKNDAAIILVQSGGGSGVFIYLATYVSGTVTYKGSNTLFLGDRITPKNLIIENGLITVEYLDRKPNEPLAAEPTVPTTRTFEYRSGTLSEK
ncbi:MAG: hypothetical protein ABIF06_01710 [bacterium]